MLKIDNAELWVVSIHQVVKYKTVFQNEVESLSRLSNRLLSHAVEDCFNRKSMGGHITSSGFVVDIVRKKILFIDHSFLQMLLQPGGHVETDLELWLSAVREVIEECGLKSIMRHEWTLLHDCPFDIDTHHIPLNVSKQEIEHVHFDFGYLLIGDSTEELQPQEEEVDAVMWEKLSFLDTLPGERFKRLKMKLIEFKIFREEDFK